jgi:hypothetical protein
VAYAYYRAGVAWARLGDKKKALAEFRKGLAIRKKMYDEASNDLDRDFHGVQLISLLARCGDHAEAEKLSLPIKRRALERQRNPDTLYRIASCFGLCMAAVAPEKQETQRNAEEKKLRQHYLDLAMQSFKEAEERGFLVVIYVDHHPDLDPLRGIPVFEAWRESFKRAVQANR